MKVGLQVSRFHDFRRDVLIVYPVRAEHDFPPTQGVNSLRAYSLPVQSSLAFVCGPREARGNASLRSAVAPRFARPG